MKNRLLTLFKKRKAKAAVVKRCEFWFCVLVYPSLYCAMKWLRAALQPVTESHREHYGFLVFFVCFIVVVCTVIEVVSRLWTYGLQGGKLKIREREGIHIEDHNI